MTNADLKKLLASCKDAPELGGGFSSADVERSRARLWKELGWNEAPAVKKYTVWEYLEYLRWEARHVFLRPVAAAGAVMGLMVGGFVATVSASGSRPGDILYPVKLATERMQLSWAGSPEQRMQLHADFAAERLQEAVDLSASDDPGAAGQVKVAVDGFKHELSSAHGALSDLSGQAPAQAAAAAALASKADAFTAILSTSEPSANVDIKDDVASAKEAAKSAQTQAVTTLVNAYEADKTSSSMADVQQNFRSEYQDISSRLAQALGRLAVMRAALKTLPPEQAESFRAFAAATQASLQPFPASLSTAQDIMAAGGYPRAFNLLNQADRDLTVIEQSVVQKEIELSTIGSDAAQP